MVKQTRGHALAPSKSYQKPRGTKHVLFYFATSGTQLPDEPQNSHRRLGVEILLTSVKALQPQ
jgi:hypothetical protein